MVEDGVLEVDPDGPQPVLFGDVSTMDDVFNALDAAGYGPVALQEIAVILPWIPVPSAGVLLLDGASVEVFALSAAQAEEAIGNILGEGATFQPPANATVWRGLEFVLVLRDAPSQPDVEDLINSIVGMPALLTIAGPLLFLPPPVPAADDGDSLVPVAIADTAAPEALPATGNGGLDGNGAGSVTAIALAASVVGIAGLSLSVFAVRRRRTARI